MARDCYGNEYSTYGTGAPTSGMPIIIHNSDGTKSQGTWGGSALKN